MSLGAQMPLPELVARCALRPTGNRLNRGEDSTVISKKFLCLAETAFLQEAVNVGLNMLFSAVHTKVLGMLSNITRDSLCVCGKATSDQLVSSG